MAAGVCRRRGQGPRPAGEPGASHQASAGEAAKARARARPAGPGHRRGGRAGLGEGEWGGAAKSCAPDWQLRRIATGPRRRSDQGPPDRQAPRASQPASAGEGAKACARRAGPVRPPGEGLGGPGFREGMRGETAKPCAPHRHTLRIATGLCLEGGEGVWASGVRGNRRGWVPVSEPRA
ncbi:hypothetical protein GCM10010309_45900 [Streptomyces violaceochromogenes]|nr:hypothetical protein GCM10010309_45900 [Streptomyces violaceochromogenes]